MKKFNGYDQLSDVEQRIYMLLHYISDQTIFGAPIHMMLQKPSLDDFNETIKMIGDQYNDRASRSRVVNCVGLEVCQLSSQILKNKKSCQQKMQRKSPR